MDIEWNKENNYLTFFSHCSFEIHQILDNKLIAEKIGERINAMKTGHILNFMDYRFNLPERLVVFCFFKYIQFA